MGRAVTPGLGQVHRVVHPAHARPTLRVAQLGGHRSDGEALPAPARHLRHERHVLVLAVLVEGGEDLLLAEHLDHLARA